MSVDLTIPGDSAALQALADWLDPGLAGPLDDARNALDSTQSESQMWWLGQSGSAFRQTAGKISGGIDPVDNYSRDAAEVFRAYARRLQRGRDRFADYLDDARDKYLLVAGNVVSLPMPPKQYIGPAGSPPPIEYGPNGECIAPRPNGWFEEAVKCYRQIARDVGNWWGDLADWVVEHMLPLIGRASDFDELKQVTDILATGNEVLFGSLIDLSNRPWEEQLAQFEESAKTFQTDFDEYYDRLRSGDPSVKALSKGTTPAEIQSHIDELGEKIKGLKIGTRILPGIGIAVDIGSSLVEVANGGSISSESAGLIGGGAAGFTAAWALGGSAIPGGVVIVAAAMIAAGATYFSKEAWEAWVPLDVREAIDAGDFGYVFE